MKNPNSVSLVQVLLLALLVWCAPAQTRAEVVRSGQWPAEENVSLSLKASPRVQAVQQLATVAGWSLIAEGVDDTAVSVEVHDQPADKVLSLLLAGADFVVEREGTLVAVRRKVEPNASATTPNRIQTPAGKPGEDLFITEQGHVGKDQVVRDLFVVGSAVVEGTVTGSVVLFGGEAHLVRGAHVSKDVIAFGGSIDIEDGVEIGGDVAALFGALRRGDGPSKDLVSVKHKADPWQEFFSKLFEHLTSAVIAWLIGAITLAMAGARLNVLREEIERRPLRSLGTGVVIFLAALVLIVTLVFTLVGIPLAVLSAVLGVAATYLSFSALPLAVGRRLVGKRSDNPYVHLAIGCGVLFLVLCVPVAGALLSVVGAFIALGALFSTRAAGLFKRTSVPVSI